MKGEVNGRAATILVDSGAQRTIVKASLVNAADYTDESIPITTYILEEAVSRLLANITITTANFTLFRQAAVVDDHMIMGSEDVLLSICLGSTEKLADLLLGGEPYMPNPPAIINVTRVQEKRAVAAARTDETEERPQCVEDAIIPDDEQVEESPPLTPTLETLHRPWIVRWCTQAASPVLSFRLRRGRMKPFRRGEPKRMSRWMGFTGMMAC